VSKRSKRRRDPRTAGNEGGGVTQRAAAGTASAEGSGGSEARSAEAPRADRGRSAPAPQDRAGGASSWSLGVQIAVAVAVFAVVSLIAELAGAANLGVALGVGQVAFAMAVIYLLARR
jgi:hypothetical protein